MIERILKRARSDSGDSTLISTVLVLPLLLILFFSVIDISIWFNNRSILTSVARDSARTVAIMGGSQSPLAADYLSGAQDDRNVENNLYETLSTTVGLINVSIDEGSIDCGPDVADGVGAETYCQFEWTYGGVGLSAFALVASDDTYGSVGQEREGSICGEGGRQGGLSALAQNCTRGTAESEVGFS